MYSSNEYYRPSTYTSQSLTKTVVIEPTPDVAQLKYGGIADVSTAKAVAKRIFERYDRDRDGFLSNLEVTPMISDAYAQMNRRIQPTRQDVESFFRVCDRNKDGRVNYEDIESLCVKYLTTSYEIRK
jgi:hypothetical protein